MIEKMNTNNSPAWFAFILEGDEMKIGFAKLDRGLRAYERGLYSGEN